MSAKDSNFKEDDRALPLFKIGKGNSQQKKTIKVRIFTEIISFVLVFYEFFMSFSAACGGHRDQEERVIALLSSRARGQACQ